MNKGVETIAGES